MITPKGAILPTFAPKIIPVMSNSNYQDSAMEYALWYLEHLLKMEDVMGQRIEQRINELLEQKVREYMEKGGMEKKQL